MSIFDFDIQKLLNKVLNFILRYFDSMELNNTVWYSELGSHMELKIDSKGNITGSYHTAVGEMTANLAGRFDKSGGTAFGWTVAWPKDKYPSNSATSWAANYTVIDNIPTIVSSWIIREKLEGNNYDSTVCGCENYTQTPPTKKTLESNKCKRPSHPL